MMRAGLFARYAAVACVAVSVGWWVRGADRRVLAQRSSSSSSARGGAGDNLAFQVMGTGPDAALAVFNPGNRTLYVYNRVGAGNSSVSCTFSFTISTPGAAIQRENCPVGDLLPGR